MATIDLSVTTVREANELLRKYGADGIDVEVVPVRRWAGVWEAGQPMPISPARASARPRRG